MYVELYILDNWVMNLIILRLAACFLGKRPNFKRDCVFSAAGAVYAFFALLCQWLMHPVLKIALCFFMALSLKPKGLRCFLLYTAAVALSTFLSGGITYALVLSLGGRLSGGYMVASTPLRIAIYAAFILTFAPNLLRRIRGMRITNELTVPIVIEHDGNMFSFIGFIDTGNSLRDPLTALPGLLVYCPELSRYADTPVSTRGAFKEGIICGFKPDRLKIGGFDAAGFIFLATDAAPFSGAGFQALIPPDALPLKYKNNLEDVKCKKLSERLLPSFWRRFSSDRSARCFISARAKRSRRR